MTFKNNEILALLMGGQSEQAKLFVAYNKEKYIIVSKKGTDGYYFDESTKLWTELAYSQFITEVIDFLHKMVDQLIASQKNKLKADDVDEDDKESINKKIKQLERLRVANAKTSHGKSIIELITNSFHKADFMNQVNTSEHILPIKNGRVINLKTLEIRERVREDYFTYELDVDYTKEQPNASKFFSQLMCDDKDKLKVFQRMLGYSITGNIDAKCYFVLIGCGDNGKSALMRVIKKLFGQMYVAIQKSILFSENRMKSDLMPYLACLAGMRFGVYNEPSDKLEMNESMIKAITGGDEIIGKKLYRDPFSFTPIVKMWIMTNKIIKFDSCSEPMVKRTKLINMEAQFLDKPKGKGQYKKDPEFCNQLENEYKNEVFSFVAMGAYLYYKNKNFGDEECTSMVAYKTSYMEDIDITKVFLRDRCKIMPDCKPGNRISTTELFMAFCDYCKEHDMKMINREKFYESLRMKKIIPQKKTGTYYYNIILCETEADEEEPINCNFTSKNNESEDSSDDDEQIIMEVKPSHAPKTSNSPKQVPKKSPKNVIKVFSKEDSFTDTSEDEDAEDEVVVEAVKPNPAPKKVPAKLKAPAGKAAKKVVTQYVNSDTEDDDGPDIDCVTDGENFDI